MRLPLTLVLIVTGLASIGAQPRVSRTWIDSLNTPAFAFGASGNDAGIVRVTLRAASHTAEFSARAEAVQAFGDSAAVLLARRPTGSAMYSLAGPHMKLTYASSGGGEVVHFGVQGNSGVDVAPTLQDALRIVGILRGAAFSAMEQHRIAMHPRQPYLPAPGAGVDTYFESQVDRPASPRAGNRPPIYPPMLKSANVEGQVLVQFIVDTLGRVDTTTLHVLKSTHELFTQAVRKALSKYSFRPAELAGRKVKQLVQVPFDFSLAP